MSKHSYIELCIQGELDRSTARQWFDTVRTNLPNGVLAPANIIVKGAPKISDFYIVKNNNITCYRVPLTRDLAVTEVQQVAIAWNNAYPQGDFEIDYSSVGTAQVKHKEISEIGLKEVALEAARLSHSTWLHDMSNRGWRYGQQFNQKNKTNPMLKSWDELASKYKLQELDRFLKLMEVLDRMNLRLARKDQ